jgi:hypothetical protein
MTIKMLPQLASSAGRPKMTWDFFTKKMLLLLFYGGKNCKTFCKQMRVFVNKDVNKFNILKIFTKVTKGNVVKCKQEPEGFS